MHVSFLANASGLHLVVALLQAIPTSRRLRGSSKLVGVPAWSAHRSFLELRVLGASVGRCLLAGIILLNSRNQSVTLPGSEGLTYSAVHV
ncbi:hypothetical protein DER44DRAFT_121059 [Fusarium oxysporum]|nr:hypothetical protein DER44DRAFT_121059 [Fusarium oxysporum]